MSPRASQIRRIVCLLLFLLLAACSRQAPPAFHATDISGSAIGSEFALADQHGQLRHLADFRGRVVLLFFGYTHCPDVCPTTLARLARLMPALGAEAGRVQVLFVTLDPERDTLPVLADYVPWFHPSFLGLRGDAATTATLTAAFKVVASRQAVPGGMGYVIDHTAAVYAYDPQGRLRLYLRPEDDDAGLLADIRLLLAGR
jgi:protein SCO1/2